MQAIVLAAGLGTRLRAAGAVKPLVEVAGRSLLQHALDGLFTAGATDVLVVTGHGAAEVAAAVAAHDRADAVRLVHNADFAAPNGVSVLAARAHLRAPALLVMADHLVDPQLYARVARHGGGAALALGVDRRLDHPWIDPADVTRVWTMGAHLQTIGKQLDPYNGYDTGVFLITDALMEALATMPAPGLSDGVRALAARGEAHAVETGDLGWIDVDDPRALGIAQDWMAARLKVGADA